MKSPITGGEVKMQTHLEELEFRGEIFDIVYHNYKCVDTGEEFTTSKLDDLNLSQLHNKYRAKHKIPFPEDIQSIRNKYGVSQNKMSLILGFGKNTYRKYEHGDIPSLSNAKLIKIAEDPEEFIKLVEDCDELKESEQKDIMERAEQELDGKESKILFGVYHWLFDKYSEPSEFNGFTKPSLDKFMNMVKFFASERGQEPHKTKLNKLLFYADFSHYKRHGRSISGVNYRAITLGPVPNRYDSLFDLGVDRDEFLIEYIKLPKYDNPAEKFISQKPVDNDVIEDKEIETLQLVKDKLGNIDTQTLVDMSHEEEAWKNYQNSNDAINYESAFKLKYPE